MAVSLWRTLGYSGVLLSAVHFVVLCGSVLRFVAFGYYLQVDLLLFTSVHSFLR
jgi:hypothetical protein